MSVQDFYEKLPKQEFTLTEWAQFCADNPQYLTVNNPLVNYITMSLTKGNDNIKQLSDPIDVLKDRLSRANIIKNQKVEFNDIYTKCLASDSFEYVDTSDYVTHKNWFYTYLWLTNKVIKFWYLKP